MHIGAVGHACHASSGAGKAMQQPWAALRSRVWQLMAQARAPAELPAQHPSSAARGSRLGCSLHAVDSDVAYSGCPMPTSAFRPFSSCTKLCSLRRAARLAQGHQAQGRRSQALAKGLSSAITFDAVFLFPLLEQLLNMVDAFKPIASQAMFLRVEWAMQGSRPNAPVHLRPTASSALQPERRSGFKHTEPTAMKLALQWPCFASLHARPGIGHRRSVTLNALLLIFQPVAAPAGFQRRPGSHVSQWD